MTMPTISSTSASKPNLYCPIGRGFLRNALLRSGITLLLLLLMVSNSRSWVYPEHRTIMAIAINMLDSERRSALDAMWAQARLGYEARLCESVADATLTVNPAVIDYAAWPAIGGDHSCSPAKLLHTVLETDWILSVADIAAQLKIDLEEAGGVPYKRINALRDSDIKFQRTDPEYATRAGANSAHFLLPRSSVTQSSSSYAKACLAAGSELNGLGAYTWFHLSALLKAGRLAREDLTAQERASLTRAALADEAFALHFLEDAFASGHATGTWGDVSLRKGTHDYYNEYGFETRTWSGESIVLTGDAWMRDEDAERAAKAVRISLEQLLDASSGIGSAATLTTTETPTLDPDNMDTCTLMTLPEREVDEKFFPLLREVLMDTPIPGLQTGLGELPRFRAELGPFLGIAPALRTATMFGGFGRDQVSIDYMGGLEVALRLGLGLDGVMNEAGDGLVFLDLGIRNDVASTLSFSDVPELNEYGSITAAIPNRTSWYARLRMPFWLIPGDLILAVPLLFAAPETYTNMAVIAGGGGLIPWQSGIMTPIGRFQFMLGREVGVTFFGYGSRNDRLIVPVTAENFDDFVLIDLRSIQLEFPFLEYRPFRTFSVDQSSSLAFQLYGAVDIPTRVTIIEPVDTPDPNLRTIWHVGLRIVFDWRYYF